MSFFPLICKGGNPSFSVYVISAPKLLNASTKILIGLWCILSEPDKTTVLLDCVAKKAVKNLIAVPA